LNYGTVRHGSEVYEHAEKIAAAIEELGGRAIIKEADTRDEKQVKSMVKAAESEFGQVDILVNNAGGQWHSCDWLSEVIADPHWGTGITVNCIELGETSYLNLDDMVKLAQGDNPEIKVTALAPITLKKIWTSAWHDHPGPTGFDIAEIIAFLCSNAGRFVTGSLIRLPNR